MQIDPAMFPHIGLGSSPVIIDLPSIPVGHMRTSVLPRFAVKGKNSTPIPAVVVWTSPWPYEVGKTPTAEDWAHEKDDVAPVFAMVTRWLLEASIEGVGKHNVTPIFPIGIFGIKKGVNAKKGDPNYDLKLLAIKSMPQLL